ncbi:MAG: tRNA pseudouridine(38-40) synthase TruA [Myxococcaceae bacterium]|nr:tRNA pseudouridine(38-40) synthase TruA [Myxococcaceae bacterium]
MKEQPSRLVALWCWYHGGAFRGYQSQPQGPTVQDTLIAGLRAAGLSRNPVPSGRTDLGVHARMQVLGMRVVEDVAPEDVAARLNAVLPKDVGIACSRAAPRKFHPQWKATAKEYRYRLLLEDDAAWAPFAWRTGVDPERVREVLSLAVGTRDFFAFHDKSSTQMPRTVREVSLSREGPIADLHIVGDGFARYMVRYLVGGAVAVARGELSVELYRRALEDAAPFDGVKAPAQGLILWEVRYPDAMNPFRGVTPELPPGPPFYASVI